MRPSVVSNALKHKVLDLTDHTLQAELRWVRHYSGILQREVDDRRAEGGAVCEEDVSPG